MELTTGDGVFRSQVPAESNVKGELTVLRDGDDRFGGLAVKKAIEVVKTTLLNYLIGQSVLDQEQIDGLIQENDPTERFD